jgi:hypothetical protein
VLAVFESQAHVAAHFLTNLRGLAVPCSKVICGRDGFARDFGRSRYENLSGAISWFTFSPAEQRRQAKPKGLAAGTRTNGDWFSAEAEERPLFSPVGRQPRR